MGHRKIQQEITGCKIDHYKRNEDGTFFVQVTDRHGKQKNFNSITPEILTRILQTTPHNTIIERNDLKVFEVVVDPKSKIFSYIKDGVDQYSIIIGNDKYEKPLKFRNVRGDELKEYIGWFKECDVGEEVGAP